MYIFGFPLCLLFYQLYSHLSLINKTFIFLIIKHKTMFPFSCLVLYAIYNVHITEVLSKKRHLCKCFRNSMHLTQNAEGTGTGNLFEVTLLII